MARLSLLTLVVFVSLCRLAADVPRLEFRKIIGDMRGKGMDNLSVTVADDGTTYLLMTTGRVAVFGADGKYLKSLDAQLPWPHDHAYISAWRKQVLLGDYRKDYPWVFSERRTGEAPGRFRNPSMAAPDNDGTLYVADTDNRRVQLFAPHEESTPRRVISLDAKPTRLDARNGTLALLLDDQTLRVLDSQGDPPTERGRVKVGTSAVAVAIAPDTGVLVAFSGGPDRHFLKKYQTDPATDKLKELAVIAPSYLAQWPNLYPAAVPLTSAPNGAVWFATGNIHGRVLALDPATDAITEKMRSLDRPLCVGFGADGKVFVGGSGNVKSGGKRLRQFLLPDLASPGADFPAGNDLYKEDGVPVWGLLPDQDGGVFVRIVEKGYRKGWPALTIKKVFADGTMKPFVDFGDLYAKRTTFHPSSAVYSLQFAPDGNFILAALPLVSVCKIATDGKIIWEAGIEPQGGADKIEFGEPRATASDSRGRIWVADAGKDQVFCLSPQGKRLLAYGTRANVDDLSGKGFHHPTAVATATVHGAEFLYVGDAGNQRIVKYQILEQNLP